MRSTIKTLAIAALTVGALVAAPAAFAANEVTQDVIGGQLSASVTNVALSSVAASHEATAGTGTLALAMDDLSGTGEGWNVTLEAKTGFVHGGAGPDIAAANFSVTPAAITPIAGQNETGLTPGSTGTLDGPVRVVSAAPGSGMGSYTQAITADLTVPADTLAGTYTGTLTTTIVAGNL